MGMNYCHLLLPLDKMAGPQSNLNNKDYHLAHGAAGMRRLPRLSRRSVGISPIYLFSYLLVESNPLSVHHTDF